MARRGYYISNKALAQYSFDFAQQVHIPSDPLTSQKCALFGICCEAIPKQVSYQHHIEHMYFNTIILTVDELPH